MNIEWLVPYLLVAVLVFLIPKLFGMLGKGKSAASGKSTFVPHYTYVVAGIIVAGILLYTAAKVIITVVGG
ncbi:hypothetical protein [Geobacter grbiciae]|uniref:hypothetical protein n=1 Tax=Geobacter grbiciae TaxID=155042 RepID=UPI001C038B77|nr:hypothetical protein [Geobacter grbiciae]MBT1075628.1 hypothetical protein [Geobacter grbiciae]